jgi:hypothetical protein
VVRARRHAERELRHVHRLPDRQPAVLAHLEILAGLDRVGADAHLEAVLRLREIGTRPASAANAARRRTSRPRLRMEVS